MLTLTRKAGERILIPEVGVEIVIRRVLPNKAVRVGVVAPQKLTILREELLTSRGGESESTKADRQKRRGQGRTGRAEVSNPGR
jgi:carbon storage regulator CsrA